MAKCALELQESKKEVNQYRLNRSSHLLLMEDVCSGASEEGCV